MQTITMENLFEEWASAIQKRGVSNQFVKDGIIDNENYKNIVWILRETNGFSGDLASLIKDSIENPNKHPKYWKHPMTHHKVSLAIAGLLHPSSNIDEIKKMKRDGYRYAAVVNIKKTEGKESANIDEIVSFFNEDKVFLKHQLEILEPKVVIIGGMRSVKRIKNGMINLFGLEKREENVYFSKELNAYFIATYHPSYPAIKLDEWIRNFQNISQKYGIF